MSVLSLSHPLKDEITATLAAHPFRPAWWLPGAHTQTVWPSLLRKRPRLKNVQHVRIDTPDGDFIDTWVQPGASGAPAVLLLHGLEGSFRSRYIQGMHAALAQIGWTAITMEHRSCGDEMNRCRRMYHMGETADLDFLARKILNDRPGRLYAVGYSLGGNVLVKWLGQSGKNLPERLAGGAAISSPYDLPVSAPYLDRPLMWPYRFKFLRTLKKKAILKDKQFPGIVDLPAVLKSSNFEQFDTLATAPIHGFRDAEDYWRQSSCGQFLHNVRRPLLLLSAQDDPFIQAHTFPLQCANESDYLYPLFTKKGGHTGFVQGSIFRPQFWAEQQTLRFFQSLETAVLSPES